MSKLVDIETIRKEVDRLTNWDCPCENPEQDRGFYDALGRINQFLMALPEEKPVNIITELENLLEANGMYIDNDWKVRCNNGDSTDNRWQYELVARHFYSIRQGGHKNE